MKVDLHNFFKFYDDKNPHHVKSVQWLEDHLPAEYLDDSSEWIKTYRIKAPVQKVLSVPYYPQTDNYRDASRTCNSSSCAMCLEYFKPGTLKGSKGDDSYIQKVFSVGDTTDHEVQTKVLNSYGVKSHFFYNLGFDDIDKSLDAGKPVVIGILHRGPLSAPTGGHMIVVIGRTDNGNYVINDPYGDLNDGYTSDVYNGKGTIYKKSELSQRWLEYGKDNTGWGRIFDVNK